MELKGNGIFTWHRDQCQETDEKILNEEPLTSSLIFKGYEGFPLSEMEKLRQKRSKSSQEIEQTFIISTKNSQQVSFSEINTKQRSCTSSGDSLRIVKMLEENSLLRKQLENKNEEIAQLRFELAKQKQTNIIPINFENTYPRNKEKSKNLNVNRSSQLMKSLSIRSSNNHKGITPASSPCSARVKRKGKSFGTDGNQKGNLISSSLLDRL